MATVYKDFDQETLDKAYDNRGRFPDTDACKQAQLDASDAAKSAYESKLDVRFGDGDSDLLDIYFGQGTGKRPIHVFFHGGWFKSNTKNDFGFVATPFVPHGVTTVVVEYPLIPSVRMETLIDRCRASLEWVWRNAESFGGDRDKITISGHSAGGHIAQMMMQTDFPSYGDGLPGDLVKAGCSISGVSDLEPVRFSFHNEDLQFSEDEAKAFSTLLMEPAHKGPLLAVVGDMEGEEFMRHTTALAEAWSSKGMDVEYWEMNGKHHFTTINQYIDPDSELSKKVRAMAV